MTRVITLTGPSMAGKSTVLQHILKCASGLFKPVITPKYTTRDPRPSDGQEVICVDRIPAACDLVYEQYGVRYGLSTTTIYHALANGSSPVVILNDVRAVEDIRRSLGATVCSAFVFRERPRQEGYALQRADSETRYEKARAIYRIYIENIYLFDHVLLNSGSRTDLQKQVKSMVRGAYAERFWPLKENG